MSKKNRDYPCIQAKDYKKPWPIKEMLLSQQAVCEKYLAEHLECDCFTRYTSECLNAQCKVKSVKEFKFQVINNITFVMPVDEKPEESEKCEKPDSEKCEKPELESSELGIEKLRIED
jgi:hypothetical protein